MKIGIIKVYPKELSENSMTFLNVPYQVMVRPRGVEEAEVAALFAGDGDENGVSTHGWKHHCSPLKSARRPRRVIPT